MLPKIWKKVLLAICILACLFNVMSKLVNRTTLEKNVESIKNGISFSELLKSFDEKYKDENTNTINNETSDAVSGNITQTTTENSVEDYITTTNGDGTTTTEDDGEYVIIY